jgi:hypothetical protein
MTVLPDDVRALFGAPTHAGRASPFTEKDHE